MKKVILLVAVVLAITNAYAQKRDTVIVNLAKTSRIIFTVEDPADLEILKHYDIQQLFEDILKKVAEKTESDSTTTAKSEEPLEASEDEEQDEVADASREDDNDQDNDEDIEIIDWGNDDDDDNDDDNDDHDRRGRWNRTWQTFNFDLGTNNYLQDNEFPSDNDAYAVRPWGSWYVGAASIQRSRIAKKFFLEWGLGLSWYTFKFQNDNTVITKDETGVYFSPDPRDVEFKKSKLSVTYLHASLIPVLDFGDHGRRPRVWDGYNHNSFRIGFGPYIGYRISSASKLVYSDDGREREKNRDGFYLNNFRYGARLQVGYRSTDLFFNYDLNELFQDDKGPQLNAFSFGVIF